MEKQDKELLIKVKELHARNQLSHAEEIYKYLLAKYPQDLEILNGLGVLNLQKGNLEDGITYLEKYSKINFLQPEVLNNLTVALMNNGQLFKAKKILNDCIKEYPNSPNFNFNMAQTLKELGDLEGAILFYKKSFELDENNYIALNNLGVIYHELGDYNKALKTYLQATSINNIFADGYFNCGVTYQKLDQNLNALEQFKKCININPQHHGANFISGEIFLNESKFHEAIPYFKKIIEFNPESAAANNNLGVCFLNTGKINESIKFFNEAIKLNSEYAEAYNNIGSAYEKNEQNELAIVNYQKAIEKKSDFAIAYNNLGAVNYKNNNFIDSINYHKKALLINDKFAMAYCNLADAQVNIKDYESAKNNFEKAIDLDPNNSIIKYNASVFFLRMKNFNRGFELYESRLNVEKYRLKIGEDLPEEKLLTKKVKNKVILILPEQGIGDNVFYLSALNDLLEDNRCKVILDKRLINLFKRSFPSVEFYEFQNNNHEILNGCEWDYFIPLSSLFKIYRSDFISPNNLPSKFLLSDEMLSQKLKKRLKLSDNSLCGISWKSSAKQIGEIKSLQLKNLEELFKFNNIKFINLQYGEVKDEIQNTVSRFNVNIEYYDDIDYYNDIDTLASLINCCDYVVTTSNITAHLSGALGKKTYLLLPYSSGKLWYWHDKDGPNIWYPSINVYNQVKENDWTGPIKKILKDMDDDRKN